MASSFFSDFGLIWCLEELKKEEFRKFKEHLKQETLQPGLQQIPWTEVKKASREDLANLLVKHYEEQQMWNITLKIFHKISRQDLCDKVLRERTGHRKLYQDHVRKKFSDLWSSRSIAGFYAYFRSEVRQEEREHLERVFAPSGTGKQPYTLVIHGMEGIGKTTFLMKVMLAWSETNVYQDRFLYVFYFCCRELKQLTETSLAELISRDWPSSSAPITEIMSQPERLLFIIDSFEQLQCELNEPESDLCSDWMKTQPVRMLLSSLLRKKMLPESSLLIGVASPPCPVELEDQLVCPELLPFPGFSESDRKLFFCCLFQDRSRAMEAFDFVRKNKQLFIMCEIPLLCWIVCTCVKQEMEKGKDLALTCRRATSLFSSFVFNLFTPKGANCPNQQSQFLLKGLCSLAAEGMWTEVSEFSEQDLRRNGIVGSDIPALLDTKILVKCTKHSYMFIHMSIQEFCAAMFYLLKIDGVHPNPAVRFGETVLLTYLKTQRKARWISLGSFICGLLHENEQEKLDAFFGFQLSREIKQQFHQCLKSLGEREDLQRQTDFLALFYCLFEMQDEAFARQAVNFLQEVNFCIHENSDLEVCAYCLKYCSGLRKLRFSVQKVFKEENGQCSMSSGSFIHWHHVCSVLTANEHLKEFKLMDSNLNESALMTLCNQLRHPSCRLQTLELNAVSFSGESMVVFEVLFHNPDLKHLNLFSVNLSRGDVQMLCKALTYRMCNIEKLALGSCSLSLEDCEVFASVLSSSKKLKHLNLSCNYLDQGMRPLCEALCHPDCVLEYLVLAYCYLSEHSWEYISKALMCSKTLHHLDLSVNTLKDEGLTILCEALKHPDCCLWSLCLVKCFFTAAGCQGLASVLTSNQNLKNLQLGYNDIGDVGMKVLCKALTHPNCHLEQLGLEGCELTSACCKDLSSVLTSSKTLRKLNLVMNAFDHSGVVVLCEALRHPDCVLKILVLNKYEFHEETQMFLMAEEERNPDLAIIDE
ncbi:NACHT, LRR and PYD domains-containing protein 4 [Lemur catta]|uniref:NACHT, LRR and PYD domains-containing protein 4 n=1 Tax=Lemur catta TaxID=9447 RepID=UPI001E26C8C6|nr:NACHT, LRR and PYD domains-containing protein 4 [Lemur catta]